MTNAGSRPARAQEVLLLRRGLVFVSSTGTETREPAVRAFEIELGDLGYVLSTRLRKRLREASLDELCALRTWALGALAVALGADRRHEPLFRSFPEGIPADTYDLWWSKVLSYFAEGEGQPCPLCGRRSTTHVLTPCRHVVCDACWDGASYSACPVCEHHVDRSSPFFLPARAARELSPTEKVTFKRLDLGGDLDIEAKALFTSICLRKQALSPTDKDDLTGLLHDYRARVLAWLPPAIPVRENVALVFGTLFGVCDPAEVLPDARRFMTTATDVLRFLAVISGADASLQKQQTFRPVLLAEPDARPLRDPSYWQALALARGLKPPTRTPVYPVYLTYEKNRFKMAKLPRPLRRALLALLDAIPEERLIEDMLRHRSYWVWAGEFLHPHEHAKRFPTVAAAFAVIRRKAPDGTKAPVFRGFYSKMEAAVAAKDAVALSSVLAERPGELARRIDLSLRLAEGDERASAAVLEKLRSKLPAFATPVVLTLRSILPTRITKARRRLFWPKGLIANGVSKADHRALLSGTTVAEATTAIDAELCARFATKPGFEAALLDEALGAIVVPFNERTASRSAVMLPRGSRVPIPAGKTLRLFMHWCEPAVGGHETDLDLSVGFYDEAWAYKSVCSYYRLEARGANGAVIARSGGDLRNAPFPDGASELVDIHCEAALADGIRYAVMVVNAYAGMPFDHLERAFAGLMLRDDPMGAHFDPRTVALKFALAGANGVFMPLVVDLEQRTLHWLDVYSDGQLAFNNVRTSNGAITRICPEMIDYFASGARPSMLDLARYHAAARAPRVYLRRSEGTALFVRRPGEDILSFHRRLCRGEADEPRARPPRTDGPPLLAVLYRGDLELPAGSTSYALFREQQSPTLSASDLLS
ncbi:MAG: MXAN_6230/SCO0854 family RING domain-containing protein [Byssovorax sp.]